MFRWLILCAGWGRLSCSVPAGREVGGRRAPIRGGGTLHGPEAAVILSPYHEGVKRACAREQLATGSLQPLVRCNQRRDVCHGGTSLR